MTCVRLHHKTCLCPPAHPASPLLFQSWSHSAVSVCDVEYGRTGTCLLLLLLQGEPCLVCQICHECTASRLLVRVKQCHLNKVCQELCVPQHNLGQRLVNLIAAVSFCSSHGKQSGHSSGSTGSVQERMHQLQSRAPSQGVVQSAFRHDEK